MITLGIDRLIAQGAPSLHGQRVGMFTNFSAVTSDLRPSYLALAAIPDVELVALFAPEHGLFGAKQAGVHIEFERDPATALPVYSLYGDHIRPSDAALADLDTILCDIQSVGVRCYTYLWTLSYILEACAGHGKKVVVCDRPNPLGDYVAGPLIDAGFESFVGRFPIPVGYGMTLGELMRMVNAEFLRRPAELEVIPCEALTRGMRFHETGLHWVAPSPNLPHPVSVQHYPGSCLIEGTNLSEGRGTTLPFEIVGAPFIDSVALADQLNALLLPGVRFRPHSFQPTTSKWRDEVCHGVMAHITDLEMFDALPTWLNVIASVQQAYPDQFEWIQTKQGGYFIDLLAGSGHIRQQIDMAVPVSSIMQGWETISADFARARAPYLIYS